MTQTVGLGLPEGETLGGGAMEHFTFTQGDSVNLMLLCYDFCAEPDQASNENQGQ